MKNNHSLITDTDIIMTNMFFSQVSDPLQKEYYVTMIRKILKNKKGYDFDEKNIMMLIKRLNNLGYSIEIDSIYLVLTKDEIDSIPQMTDNDIQIFCQNKFNN